MPWDDDDIGEYIRENLGYANADREKKVTEILERRQWTRYHRSMREVEGGDPADHRRCSLCALPTAPRYLDLKEVCFRCRQPAKEKLEKKLKTYFWFLKEIKRLRKCTEEFESKNPDLVDALRKLK